MNVHFEELSDAQRAGGIEAATGQLASYLRSRGLQVTRSSADLTPGAAPDCVHLHGIWSPSMAMRFRRWRSCGVPCVWTPHGMLESWALAHKRVKKAAAWRVYQRFLLNRATAIHATSEREAEQFRKLGLRAPVAVIPWGVAAPPQSSAKSARAGEKQARRTALFIGRIYPVKGLTMLVEAWARVRPEGWTMRIVGPDEAGHRAEVEALIQKRGCADAFAFAGDLSGAATDEAFATAELFILPRHTENVGMAIGEALAHGLPVLTTQGAPWKLLEDESCGWWCPISTDGIAAALRAATSMTNEELAAMGERGRALVAERFHWPDIARQFVELYRWTTEGGAVPRCIRGAV